VTSCASIFEEVEKDAFLWWRCRTHFDGLSVNLSIVQCDGDGRGVSIGLEDIYRIKLYDVLVLVIEVVPRISSGSQRDFRRVVSPELPTAHAIDLYVIVERYDSNDKNQ
jgi:hypothetical protein